ncbi:hypothetical protein [Cryobacterium adonitolivorans]|uniref:hypothetical protein n=1 Tax=Cryobacterium adonitolivorans TaxID=1259189 RepID=UPI001F544941|nr:hypothetical protein [Cryobacterium adonitolivorans]
MIAISGVALLASNGVFQTPSLGDLLILVAAIVRAIHVTSMFTLTGNTPMDSLHLTTVQLATCATLFSAASLVYGDSIPHFLAHLDPGRAILFLIPRSRLHGLRVPGANLGGPAHLAIESEPPPRN